MTLRFAYSLATYPATEIKIYLYKGPFLSMCFNSINYSSSTTILTRQAVKENTREWGGTPILPNLYFLTRQVCYTEPFKSRNSGSTIIISNRFTRQACRRRTVRAPLCLRKPVQRSQMGEMVSRFQSSQRRADAQQLVTTRLLDCVHDPAGQLSRLQRIQSYAW